VNPCRGFAAAVGVTNAGGEVIVLDSAAYGPVAITKSVSIIAPPGVYGGISVFSGNGVTITAGPSDKVVLRGLTINGQGGSVGIDLVQAARVRVEGCVVSNMASTGVQHSATGAELVVLDTIIRDNAGPGISVSADASTLLDGVRVVHNAGDGLIVTAGSVLSVAVVRNSVLSYNGQGGIAAIRNSYPAKTEVTVDASVIAGNAGDGVFVGGIADGQSYTAIARSTIARNGLSGVSVFAPGGTQFVRAQLFENQFSNNAGSSIKADGNRASGWLSSNHFAGVLDILYTVNSGEILTYGQNTGSPARIGNLPTPVSVF
jgi:hypothetical protein